MEEDKTHQLSALLACRSRADLARLRGMDSPSFSFITLACKHNRHDLLRCLLKDTSDAPVVLPLWCSVEQKYEGHNAVYYAIRSSNVELLHTLLGSVTPELSERLISQSYAELILNNVLVSEEMHLFVQYKLIDLRFFSKDDGAVPTTSSVNIQERIQLLVENIAQINTYTEVDSHFLYTAKFIAQNIDILKHQLKSTYNILPWEEMEFCLVSFVSAHIRQQKLNIFYLSVLRKERLLKELDKFSSALQELAIDIVSTDVWKLRKPVKLSREDVATAIISKYPDLYADYKEVRDVSSLHVIKTYLDAALLADSATRLGQLTIKRALQVTGEHLKNTLGSPKLSPAVSDLLLLSAPKETRKVLQDLRLSLSHPPLELEDAVLYSNIQNDIKKIASVIAVIMYSSKMNKIKCMLTKLVNSDSVEEYLEIANVFRNVGIPNVQETDTVTNGYGKIKAFIKGITKKITNITLYEKNLLIEINNALEKSELLHQLTIEDYYSIKAIVNFSSAFNGSSKEMNYCNILRAMKFVATRVVRELPTEDENAEEIGRHVLLVKLLSNLYDSVSMRIEPEIAFEIKLAIARIQTVSYDGYGIKHIYDYGRQLFLDKLNKNNNGQENCRSVENITEIISIPLAQKLADLGKTVRTDRTCGQLYEHISTICKEETTNRFMVEVLVLDIMSLLDSTERVPINGVYLDGDMPLLSGKCLQNHLAHGNALADILPTDASSAVLLNAVKLTESKDLLLNCKIGNILKHDIKQLRQRQEQGLAILNKQTEMWKSLLDGNFEKFTLGIAQGADIFSRKEDLSSTLHYAARGSNIETIKFLTKQEMFSTEMRDINGQTALHVAANFGRDVIVKFLVAEMGNTVNQVDDAGKTPLHLAAQNGHKETVITLISLGAKTTDKDVGGNSPLHYAVMNNYLDVVKILLEKDATVDENTVMGGYTALHTAAELGYVDIVQYLLLNKASVNAKTNLGAFPLLLSVLNGHQEVVCALLEKGAHVNLRVPDGHYPLHFAVENDYREIVKVLLDKGANVNNGNMTHNHTPFHTAVANGNAFIVGVLLQYNANVNARRIDGQTPLNFAANCGHAGIAELLLGKGALAESRDVNGITALHIAAQLGHTSVVETLIQRGADIHTQNIEKCTPLHLAAQAGRHQVVQVLLAAGANVNSVDNIGFTALHLSAGNGHEAVLETLLKKGGNVNCRDYNNATPIHIAAAKACNEKTIQMLLKYGANVSEKHASCSTALHFASFEGNTSVVEALLQGMADVDARSKGGGTALHLAASGNHKAVVEILLKYGADVNLSDATGSSALCCAAKNKNKDLMDILIANGADVNVGGNKLLVSALRAGYRLVVEALLKNKNIDISIKGVHGSLLLYAAAEGGDAVVARELIKRGIKVADCTRHPSPLIIAMSLGHTEFVEVLLENAANVNPTDPNRSPLFHAVLVNKPDIMERLLHWGANSNIRDLKNKTPLELAVTNAQMQNTLILLQQVGARINDRGNEDWTLLHIAAQAGNLEITKLLVDRGADINARSRQGSKPIHIAAGNGDNNIFTFFLELGMSIDDQGAAGATLMHCAAVGGQLAMAQYLMDKHVDINSADFNGFMPIHRSAKQGNTEMVKLLLHSGAVYDAKNNSGKTPADLTKSRDIKEVLESIGNLFKAVKRNDVLMVEVLVKDLAKYVDVKSSDNATLLHIASWKGFQEVCDNLLKSKANPSAVGKGGNTPLHYASKFSHPGIVLSLLKSGAAHNLQADNMKTPLDFATHEDIKSLLQMIALCFTKVQTRNVEVIKDITSIKDVEIIKAVMKARDTDGNTLVVVAMKYGFPNIDELKQVSQANASLILSKVDSMFMLERFTEAIDMLKQLLKERTEILGENNPGTLDIQHQIMLALYKQSKYFEAIPMLEDIYCKRVELLGPDHADCLDTRSFLALLLHRLGRNNEAWDIFQEIMPKQQEVLGEGHVQLMQTKTHAALVLQALGKHEDALRLNPQIYKRN